MKRDARIDVFAETMIETPSETLVGDSVASDGIDDDLAGEMLAHFQVKSLIRSGGMGSVWRAHDISLDRPVALKVLTRELSENPTFVERFEREARSQARLSHGNVVPIYYIGDEDGHMFFAMELIEGGSLADRMECAEPTDWEEALELMIGVARGLRHAHERGLIHRDIKPGNLLLDEPRHVKVTDFGLARPIDTDKSKLTGKGQFLGTPWYSSPEQARALRLDHRSDMYSLGATFFHVLTGRPLFRGRTPVVILAKHAGDPPQLDPLRAVAPDGLVDLFARMLAKRPADRFADHDELTQALKRLRLR